MTTESNVARAPRSAIKEADIARSLSEAGLDLGLFTDAERPLARQVMDALRLVWSKGYQRGKRDGLDLAVRTLNTLD